MEEMGPERIWRIGRYRIERYPILTDGTRPWGFSDGMLGVTRGGPFRAFFHWLWWRREYNSKPPGYWAE